MIKNYILIFIFSILFLPTLIIYIPEFDENNTITQDQNQLDTTQLRLPFIENQGQIPSEYKYYAKTFAGTIYVTDSDLTYHSIKNENDTQTTLVIKEKFLGNSLNPYGKEKSESVVNYFKGTQDNWKTNIPTYNYVSLGQIWDNVDVDLKAHGNNMEKIFTIHPGGDPSDIQMSFDGISNIVLAENELKIGTDLGDVFLSKPIGYQVIDGKKYNIPVSYDVLDSTTYGFSVLSYDPRFDLVIDPLIASTFVGGSNIDTALYDLVRDSSGNVYITGSTKSTDYPIVSGYDSSHNGDYDVFVSKLNSNLSSLSASTFIGGTSYDESETIALDSSGNVYITGYTSSTNYPIVSGYDSSHNGDYDVFVSKLNSNLSSLSASTFIGGTILDLAWDIALDSSGNVYIIGQTNSTNYPIVSGYDSSFNGVNDAFVSKLNSNLSSLSASTFIGGSMSDYSYGIVLDSSGNVYITGSTKSTDYPIVSGYDSSFNGVNDAFVSKLNSNLSSLSASTFIGGSVDDASLAIALDSSGNVYITGATNSTNYPAANGYDSSYNAGDDAFVSKLNSNLSSLSASTFIGGSLHDISEGITLDSAGNVYITGYTTSTSYPTVSGAYDTSHNGNPDVFVSKLNSNLSSLSASTFIGGTAFDYSTAIALDSSGNVYITGQTNSTGYPTVSGYDSSHNGNWDVFVSYFDCGLSMSSMLRTCPEPTDNLGLSDNIQLTKSSATSFTSTGTVPADGAITVTLPQNTAGSTNTVVVDMPATVAATITVSTTNSGTSDSRILFVGQVLDIGLSSASSSFTYQVRMTFTDADLTAAGLSLSRVTMYRDANENGSFETNESLTTTITPSSAPGPYTATANVPANSKFSIGGVAGSVSVNAAAGIGAAGHFLGLLPDHCDESGFGNGKSLRVYEISYDKCDANQITILADTTCGPMKIQVGKENNMNVAGMSSEQPYLNDEKRMIILSSPITSNIMDFSVIVQDKRDEFYEKITADQCTGTKQYTFTTGYTSEQTNAIPLSLPDWIKNNAKWWSDGFIDDNTFVNGIQYLVKNNIISVQKSFSTEYTTDDISDGIPDWIKNNAKWWSDGSIDDNTFVNGIQYLVNNGVIKVD